MIPPLNGRHRIDNRLQPRELLLIHLARGLLHARKRPNRRKHLQNRFHAPHLLDLKQLLAEIIERESISEQRLLSQILTLLAVKRGLGPLNQRHHVAHAQDASNDAVRMKWFERVRLLAHADKLDRLPCDMANRKRRAAARVAIHLRQNHARQPKTRMKILC